MPLFCVWPRSSRPSPSQIGPISGRHTIVCLTLLERHSAVHQADGFAWLTLFWLEVRKHGYQSKYGNYLRLSYALAPYEGWIALWRSKLAIAVLDQLPDDLSAQALDEFTGLVETERLYPESMAIFASALPGTQARLAERLKTAKPVPRQVFARMLYDSGTDVTIPGVDATPSRPWR